MTLLINVKDMIAARFTQTLINARTSDDSCFQFSHQSSTAMAIEKKGVHALCTIYIDSIRHRRTEKVDDESSLYGR